MNKKKILTIGLLALLTTTTLTGCGKTDFKWDWNWLNPITWFNKDKPAEDITEETTEESSDLTPEGLALAKKISFEVSKAFGETDKKTITNTN